MYQKIGIVLAVLNLLMVVMSTNFFLNMAKCSLVEWLMFNACAPSVLLFLLGYLSRQKIVMYMSIPALLFFGGGGMFIFGWTGTAIISQVGHIFMVAAAGWMVYGILKEKNYKEAAIGLLLAAVLVNAFIAVQQGYAYSRWIRLEQIINYDPFKQMTYEGTLPGADCSGLRTVLTLYQQNDSYFLKETYLATRDGDKTFTSFGRWRKFKDRGREIIQLDWDKPEGYYNYLVLDDLRLEVLGKGVERIESPFNLTLTRRRKL